MTVAVIDYGSGNLHSAAKALERASRESGAGEPILVTRDPEEVRRADRVVLPGVGAFADCKRGLDAVPGMVAAMTEAVRTKGKPFLGICVGMQLMAERGREYVVTEGLGWIKGEVDRITPSDSALKIPHMGWNTLNLRHAHPLLDGIATGPQVMFDKPDLFWGLIASMWIGNTLLVILNLPLVGVWVRLLTVPYRWLFPSIILFCCIGNYSVSNNPFDVYLCALIGVLGYVLAKLECEPAPLLLGYVLGPLLEENLRRALLIARGDPTVFFTRPISLAFMIATVLILIVMVVPAARGKRHRV